VLDGWESVEDLIDDVRRWAAIGSRAAVVRVLSRIKPRPMPVLLLRCLAVSAGTAATFCTFSYSFEVPLVSTRFLRYTATQLDLFHVCVKKSRGYKCTERGIFGPENGDYLKVLLLRWIPSETIVFLLAVARIVQSGFESTL